jgi:hypothetical protein
LLAGDEVRYDVVGDATLAPDEIEVKFGHAVYLPAPDEKMLYNVSVSRDSAIWHTVCAIYPNQRLALIGGDGGAPVQGWPFGSDAALLILNDGPDAAPWCKCGRRARSMPLRSARRLLHHQGADGQRLLLKIARTTAPAGARKPRNQPHQPAVGKGAAGPIDLTAVPAAASHKPANRPAKATPPTRRWRSSASAWWRWPCRA